MEGMRKIAAAYYEQSDESGKEAAEAFFRRLNVNGDGKVSLAELKKHVPAWISSERIFRELDVNRDGILDFGEVLVVYYIVNKTDLSTCGGCYELLAGTYFSCQRCADSGTAYSLCSGCYSNVKVTITHDHPHTCLVDNHLLLAHLRGRAKITADKAHISEDKESRRKREMEELMVIVKAHYHAESSKVQDLAHKFFQSMDTDNNRKVDMSEFLGFMSQEGFQHPRIQTPAFFSELDQDGNGTLEFFEVMRLYYILQSGRPFCDGSGCANFIPGIYFSCVDCFMTPSKTTFNLCLSCYQSANYTHIHNQFRDNYALLDAMRAQSASPAITPSPSGNIPAPSNAIVPAQNHSMQHTNYPYMWRPPYYPSHSYTHAAPQLSPPPFVNPSNAIVVAHPQPNKWEKVRVAFHALNIALHIASLSGTCTIM